MKPLLLLFCYLFFINNSLVLGQNDAGCSIDGASGMQLLLEITDTEIDTNLLATRYQGNLELTECTGDEHSYFDLSVNGTHLLINSTTDFADFDKNTPKTTNSLSTVNLQCTVNCVSADTLFIQIQVTDTNNHAPEFYKDKYEFSVPVPLMPLTDFTVYGDPIIATDIDFSNQDITYTVEPDDFTITTVTTSTSKDYTAVFSTRSIILITGTREYTLTATDGGSPSLNSSTTVTITVDESQSLDTPSFKGSSYSFNYTLDNDVPTLKPNDDSITLVTIRPNAVTEPTITGEYSEYFQATFDSTSSTIDLTVTEKLPENIGSFIILTLSVSTDNSASTSIVVYLSSDNNETPQFSNHYYTGRYNLSDQVELDNVITITSTRTPTVAVSGEYAEHFTVTYKEDTKSCEIAVETVLSTSEQKGLSYIAIVIQASVDDYYDTATLVLSLPERVLQFTKAVYDASYTSDNKVTINDDSPVGFTTDVTGVNIAVDDTYVKNFEVKQESDTNTYVISVLEPLSDDVLKKQTEIVLTLTATDAFENEAKSVVTIHLPDTSVEPPTFSETVYTANYTQGDSPSIALDKEIAITNRNDQSLINIKLDSYTDYFAINYTDDKKWALALIEPLPDDILASKKEVVIILTATDNDVTGKAVLVVNWYTKEAPQFSQEYYVAKYSTTGELGSIELDETISLTNVENPDNVVVELTSYGENFELVYDSGTWDLNVSHSLSDSILTKNSELIIVLTATESGNTNEGRSILIIELPTANTLEFEEAYYVAEYPKSGTGIIEFENPIKLKNVKDLSAVEITVENYEKNFDVTYESNKWFINIKSSLDNTTLQENFELVMTLIATEQGQDNHGEAALVLKLPQATDEEGPNFSNPYYTASYPESGSGVIEFTPPIEFTNIDTPQDVEIALDSYSDNFEVKYSDRWYINIVNSLNDPILQKNTELIIALKATNKGNQKTANSVLVLQLPTSEEGEAPKFMDAFYQATYPESGTGFINFEPPIDLQNIGDPTEVEITMDKYSENFEVKYNSDKWYINITKALEDSALYGNAELLITLIAKDINTGNEGTSALFLKLPTSNSGDALEFSKPYYFANYSLNGDDIIEFDSPIEFLNAKDVSQIRILVDSHTENFEINYDENRWYIHILKKLDDDVLQKNNDLVLALIATETGNYSKAESALILRLPEQDEQVAPEFSNAYYLAKYPKKGEGVIEFENTLEISNVDDQSTITISLDSYSDNFEVKYESDRWYINITKGLDDTLLHKDPEIVMTLTATESGDSSSGKSALVLQLPSASSGSAPIFSDQYYIATYVESDTGEIEFDSSVEFTNVDDPSTVTITLDNYAENLEVKYEKERWYIHILSPLDKSVMEKNSELIITLHATQPDYQDEGYSVLVLKLPSQDDTTGLKFTKAYYLVDYPEKGSGSVEFDNPIEFLNVNDMKTVNISLSNYDENFEIVYDSNRWYLYVKKALDKDILKQQSELVITMTAKGDGKSNEAYSALVVKLPSAIGPQFSEAYYVADYPESGTGIIEIENAISFVNVDDLTTITITIDNYTNNFKIEYDSGKWHLNITKKLTDNLLEENTELVMTLVAIETGNSNEGHSALVLRLPSKAVTLGPEFSEAYYLATYPSDGSTAIQFKTPISFENVDDPSAVTISVDNYPDNFHLIFDSDKWYINITKNLDEDILKSNSELVMTLTATEEGNPNKGYSALVLQLPTVPTEVAPKFTSAYYVARYSKTAKTIDFQNAISFLNVEDPNTVTITLDSNYSGNFEITYDSDKWVLNVLKVLENDVLSKNQELVMTMVATETDNDDKGYSALVLELPITDPESGPIFSEAYYIADYPEQYSGAIEFESPIEFENVADISKITITLNNFFENFNIKLNGNKWLIDVKQILNDTVLNSNSELVMTLTATDTDTGKEGYSALVLRLPEKDNVAPIFSSVYYTANYVTSGSGANVVFTTPLDITNKNEIADVSLSLENYSDHFSIDYDNKTDSWTVSVIKQLDDEILLAKTDLVLAVTATNTKNDLTDHAAVDLILPHLNTENAPKFSKTYYTAKYSVSDGNAAVTFDSPLNISNKENLKDISISLDNYFANFKVTYDEASNAWQMTVEKNLDQSILNQKVDIVTQLTATEVDNDEIGEASLIIRLPVVNLGDAPKFSSIYYYGTYTLGDKATVQLENDIAITNKDDLSTVTISFDDNYKDKFEIVRNSDNTQWELNIKSPLTEDDFKDDLDLILTLTATETDNDKLGQAALVLHLPYEETKLPPKFSLAHYTAKYIIEDNKYSIVLNDPVTVVNKEDLGEISLALDYYDSNFGIQFDSTKQQWNFNVVNPLLEDILNSTRELVLTLTATETNNVNEGEATLIVTLPSSDVEEVVEFNQFHYTAHYNSEGNGSISMDDKIQVTTKDISSNAVVYVEEGSEYEEYFSIEADGDAYVVTVTKELPSEILDAKTDLILTLVAAVDEASSYATLIIYLPNSGVDTLRFSEALYTANYEIVDGKGKLTVEDTIEVQTAENSDLEASFSSDTGYESYFKISYSNKVVTVTLGDEEIPNDALRSSAVIPLILTVKIAGTTTQTSSVLNVEIKLDEEEERTIAFSSVLYGGTYQESDGKVNLTIIDQIAIITDESDDNVEVTITNEYDKFFSVSYSNKVVTVASSEPLTSDTLSSFSVVSLTLQAKIKNTTHTSSAVVNLEIKYDGEEETDDIEFASILHAGTYSVVDDKGQLVSDDIKVITTRPDTDIEAGISDESEYGNYFNVEYANKVVTVSVKENLPSTVLENNAFIALELVIGIKDTALSSSAVLNIGINYEQEVRSISFSNFLYSGSYEVKDGDGVLTTDKITITTNEPDANVNVAITNEYESFFSVEYLNKEVTISIKKSLTDTILNSTSVVPLALLAEITGTSVQSAAVVNVGIEYDNEGDTASIEFASVLYTGEYSVSDGKLEHDPIQVITTSSDDVIEASISEDSGYRNYFTVTYSAKTVSVELKETLPAEVTEGKSFIALTLIVGIKDTVHTSSSVLNININGGDDNDQGSIVFSKVLYNGKYEVADGTPNFTTDTITLATDAPDESIAIRLTNEYASYFSAQYSSKTIKISILTPLTEEILTTFSVIPLTIQAEIEGTTRRALAVLNIEISYNDDGDTSFIQFASILYSGEYLVSNGEGILQMDDTIGVVTNSPDTDVEVSISGGSIYRDYFDVSYADKFVTVELLKNLPDEAVKSNSFINLTLTAAINGTVHSSSSVLNIEIEGEHDDNSDDDEDKTELHHLRITFIVVTAVLSVLLLACIAGAFAYYFLRIRGDSYDNLEEDGSGKVRFGKNSLTRSPISNKSSALEERRPTGFIFHPISEDILDGSDSPNDVDKGRRKSVAFDDNVEKMQIDDTVDDDTDAYSSDKSQVTHV